MHFNDQDPLIQSFRRLTGAPPTSVTPLVQHASERRIFRLELQSKSYIGVINPNRRENDTFVAFANYFKSKGLPVPEIYHYEPDSNLYLEEDLGTETLFDYLAAQRTNAHGDPFPEAARNLYRKSLELLPRFQIESATNFDFSQCYPERDLLPGTFAGDCAAFSTQLVSRLIPDFQVAELAGDFAKLIEFLERADSNYFVYRDFQSRNIMHFNGSPYFIDFQSGRRGPLQYDVVSLLFQSSTKIPETDRDHLLQHYIEAASLYAAINPEQFHLFFSGFIIARMLQVLGVYGKLGLGAGKSYFANSIPAAVATLSTELNRSSFPLQLDALRRCVAQLASLQLKSTL
jgi:aminoglycoside/choline kinase family phosphotransferase